MIYIRYEREGDTLDILTMLLHRSIIILAAVILLNVIYNGDCGEYIISPDKGPFAEQVINIIANSTGERSNTILVSSGNYYATSGNINNFIAFRNINISKHPESSDPVNIMCLNFITVSHNGIGFENSVNVFISGLNFMNCGITTAGLYFYNTTNLTIVNSTFHYNLENGIQIVSGNNIRIIDCHFSYNVGSQPDNNSRLITKTNVNATGGVGLGLLFVNQSNVSLSIINCNFTENISYRTVNFSNDARPFAFIPSGNGGGLDIQMDKVTNLHAQVIDCNFYKNIAIHQGGGIVISVIDSTNNTVNISGSNFTGNKALGYFLREYNQTIDLNNISDFDIDDFIDGVNSEFSDFDKLLPGHIKTPNLYAKLRSTGGFGGAIAMSFYENAAYNELFVTDSNFSENLAIIAGTIGFTVRDEGAFLNRAVINNCTFISNSALFQGSAIAAPSYARVDTATASILINNCTFKNNVNLLPNTILYRFGLLGAISALRFPLTFSGRNVFHANIGGGLSVTHARVNIRGHMEFCNHNGAVFGGALRLGELTLVQVLPDANITFFNNTASQFGGAVAVENYRAANDTTLVLLNNCFIQYNIGSTEEYNPDKWTSRFVFSNNKLTDEDGQGQTVFADNIGSCVLPKHATEDNSSSIFAVSRIFNFATKGDKKNLVTAPNRLIINNSVIEASPGEILAVMLYALDSNNNHKDAVYSYATPFNSSSGVLSSIVIDLSHTENTQVGFASISRTGATRQNISFVIHNAYWLQNSSKNNILHIISFALNLVDSSNGQVVHVTTATVNLQHCHAGYEYRNDTGLCMFSYNQESGFRPDRRNRYLYIQSDRYGGLDSSGNFLTAKIPPSYQNCTQDGKLPGCLVMDDRVDEQCSQGRAGFLCGKCTKDSDNSGIALNLIECVPCDSTDIVYVLLLCVTIVAISLLIIYFNIGLPSELKGFLFFIQVVGYIYRTGVTNGKLQWHFYLSRFFGFSFFVPLCISSNLETVEVAMFGFVPPLLMAMTIITYILLARFLTLLSKRKTVDGIWFLMLIAYVYTADTCLNLLRCVQVYENEPDNFTGKRVYYFDGTLECFNEDHLPYGIVATLVSAAFLIPFPFYMLAISYNFVKNAGPLRDIICNGIEPKYIWWSSYDLFRRLLFVIVYLLFENFNSDYTQLALTISALLILIVTSRTHPFTQTWANIVNWLMLLDLVLLSAYFVNTNQQKNDNSVAIILLLLPFVYLGLYLIAKILQIIWKRCTAKYSPAQWLHPSMRRKLVHHRATFRRWGTAVFVNRQHDGNEVVFHQDMTGSSGRYEEYRDELDDYVTVDDYNI